MSTKPLCGIMILAVVAVIALSFSCNSAVKSKSSNVQKDAVSQIGFYETYSWDEVAEAFINLNNEVKKQNLKPDEFTLEQLLNTRSHTEDWSRPEYNNPTPVIGHTLVEDTARVNSIIAQYGAKFLPQDMKLAWSIKPYRDSQGPECYELIALKALDGKPYMTGESITSAKKETAPDGQYCVLFRFDDNGKQQFSRLTAQNINRYIATVIKGKVYSYPMVMCQVENGNVQVAGNFTEEEIDDLIGFIYMGK
jgi:preprotein translocase subunit SecD